MTFARTLYSIAALTFAATTTLAWAAKHDQHDSHHPAADKAAQVEQAKAGSSATSMPGMEAQMKAMREMHDKMMAAKTTEERNALMAEHMKVMQNGMNMMGGMEPGAMMGKPGDMATRQRMMEQRMDMMQSMMQMMMDRMQAVPATK